jgi:iron complex transport system substrate-binding protein
MHKSDIKADLNDICELSKMTFKDIKITFQFYSILMMIFLIIIGCGINPKENFTPASKYIPSSQTINNFRLVKHAMGETFVPLNPKRIIIIGNLDSALALGIKPVGASTDRNGRFDIYLGNQTQGIESIGMYGQPNYESILRLQPDLILGNIWDKENYPMLSKIAPTIIADGKGQWKEWLKTFAIAVGEEKEANKLLSDYEKRVENLQKKLGFDVVKPENNYLSKMKISVVNVWENDIRIYMKSSFNGIIINDVGLPRPVDQDQDKINENISLELIPKMEGDVIFLVMDQYNKLRFKQLINHPLWSRLQAVQEGRIYQVRSDVWISSWGIIGANRVLDDLFKYLLDKDVTIAKSQVE